MKTLTIARFTLQEAVSRRLILAGILISLAYVGLFALGFSFIYDRVVEAAASPRSRATVGIATATLTLMGLYVVNFLAAFLALFLSVGAVSGEIDSGTLHALLARPIRRAEFVAGRWLGFAGLVVAYVAAMVALVLLVARLISGYEVPDPVRAAALMALGALALLTLSLFGSTLLSTLANGVVVFSLLGLAWLAGIIQVLGAVLQNDAMLNLGTVVSLLVPSDALWRGASYYLQSPALLAAASGPGGGIPFVSNVPPAPALLVWAVVYPLLFLGGAVLAFSRRDL